MSHLPVLICVLVMLLLVAVPIWGGPDRPGSETSADPSGAGPGASEPFDFSGYFTYTPLTLPPAGDNYALPLKQDEVARLGDITSRLKVGAAQRDLFLKHGFVVTDFSLAPSCDDVITAYEALGRNDIPILVTSGSVLHIYHVLFDDLLSTVEAHRLYDDMWHVASGLLDECLAAQAASKGEAAEAARRDAAYLAVGLELMRPRGDQVPATKAMGMGRTSNPKEFETDDLEKYAFEVPKKIADIVSPDVDLILSHKGFAPSPLFIYYEDYSQYVPRGHYTSSEKLKNYFRAMMWFGRMSMLLKGSTEIAPGKTCRTCEALLSDYDARIQTQGALLLAGLMKQSPATMQAWEETYKVTAFFVGFSDDLGPYEYIAAMDEVFGGKPPLATYSPADQGAIKAKLAEYTAPRIYGGTGDCIIRAPFTPEEADRCLSQTRGFRLMGQRFVPDSYVMSRLVSPYTGAFVGGEPPFTVGETDAGAVRVFPRGLDVMAVLGSPRALSIMETLGDTDYEKYDKAFSDIKAQMDSIGPSGWHKNLYWNWLWSLEALLSGRGPDSPAYMQSDAWQDRILKTALASWVELRHDTILYVKQSYTMALEAETPVSQGPGYVEPCPELYNRLLALTRMTRLGLGSMNLLDDAGERRLRTLENTLDRLLSISLVEVAGRSLSDADYRFIGSFSEVLSEVVSGLEERSRRTTLVADVHTDSNTGTVLEEAVGYTDLLLLAYRVGDKVYAAAGPELSYYEFKQPLADRLTDEAWSTMLETRPPQRPW
jgi:hypothetical protein